MERTYEVPEIEVTRFGEDQTILMSGVDGGETDSPWGDEDLG